MLMIVFPTSHAISRAQSCSVHLDVQIRMVWLGVCYVSVRALLCFCVWLDYRDDRCCAHTQIFVCNERLRSGWFFAIELLCTLRVFHLINRCYVAWV